MLQGAASQLARRRSAASRVPAAVATAADKCDVPCASSPLPAAPPIQRRRVRRQHQPTPPQGTTQLAIVLRPRCVWAILPNSAGGHACGEQGTHRHRGRSAHWRATRARHPGAAPRARHQAATPHTVASIECVAPQDAAFVRTPAGGGLPQACGWRLPRVLAGGTGTAAAAARARSCAA